MTSLLTDNTEISQCRGLTLTEILAAVFVLAFGLMAAISVLPFATYMLNRMNVADTSGACGRGALQQIRMAEWQKPEALHNWNRDEVPADPYIVDPLGIIAEGIIDAGRPDWKEFPYTPVGGATLFAFNLAEIHNQGTAIDADVLAATGIEIAKDKNTANRHFRWNDDMIFAPDANSERPTLTQRKLPDGTKKLVQQAAGDYTWMYMVTPKIDPQADITPGSMTSIATTFPEAVLGYEVAAVVFHRRDTVSYPVDPYQPIRRVPLDNLKSTINATGAYIELQSGDPDELDLSSIKWILLTGPGMEVQPGNAVPLNAQWYRITGYDEILPSGTGYARRVFLVGPDWKGAKDNTGNPDGIVYAILCDGVVNVFQATMPK